MLDFFVSCIGLFVCVFFVQFWKESELVYEFLCCLFPHLFPPSGCICLFVSCNGLFVCCVFVCLLSNLGKKVSWFMSFSAVCSLICFHRLVVFVCLSVAMVCLFVVCLFVCCQIWERK